MTAINRGVTATVTGTWLQGDEKEVIIVCLSRTSGSPASLQHVCNPLRVNVAITRARRHLFVAGGLHVVSSPELTPALTLSLSCTAASFVLRPNAQRPKRLLRHPGAGDDLGDAVGGRSSGCQSVRAAANA